MLNPSDYGLRKNPFSVVPNAEVEQHWAGLPKTKQALADVVNSVRPDDVGASEFVVLHGPYGAGKSHALRYFTHSINQGDTGHAICLNEVVVGASLSFHALCRTVFDQLQATVATKLSREVREATDAMVERVRLEKEVAVTAESMIEQEVYAPDRKVVQALYERDGFPEPSDWTDHNAVKTIASAFRTMTTPIGNRPPLYGAVYLLLDEVESVFDQRNANQIAFYGALRSLINEMTEHFALILSFTAQTAMLEAALPPGLKERMTRPFIECQQLTPDGARHFVREYLEYVRPGGEYTVPQPFYPFSEAAIDTIFDREAILVPRRILMRLRRVWERAARQEILQPGEEISGEATDEILAAVV